MRFPSLALCARRHLQASPLDDVSVCRHWSPIRLSFGEYRPCDTRQFIDPALKGFYAAA
jgi:hypothetical protein